MSRAQLAYADHEPNSTAVPCEDRDRFDFKGLGAEAEGNSGMSESCVVPRSSETERPPQRFLTTSESGDSRPVRGRKRQSHLVALSIVIVLAGIGGFVSGLFSKHQPSDPVRPKIVEPFALKDTQGRDHTLSDWRDTKAVILFVVGRDCPTPNTYGAEMRRLCERYGPSGALFLGLNPEPDASADSVARFAQDLGLTFPILLDPAHELTVDLGVRVTPAAVVLDNEGHLLYQGAFDDRSDAEKAIVAAINNEPVSTTTQVQAQTPAQGRPLPKPGPIIAPGETISYHEHVAPILGKHCAACHRPGEVGPFSLLTYRDGAKRAAFLSQVTEERRMPPWRAMHGYGDFQAEGRLSRRELAILSRWTEQGAPEGDPALAKAPPRFPEGWQLGSPDLVVSLPEPFEVPATGDYYRAFVVPLPIDRDQAVATIEFRPDNHRVVHHARFYFDPTNDCRKRDAADPLPGFPTLGGSDIPKPGLGAWVPGAIPQFPPPDVGKVVRKGSDLIVMIHYHGTGKKETDRSSLGLFFCKAPPKRSITHISLTTAKIDIAPGEKRHRIALTSKLAANAHAVSVMPHGHFLMREISLTAILPSGRVVPMLWVNDWDFNWQGQYYFARPVALPKGTRLDVVAYYDNSADNPSNPNHPPRRVRFGEASTDEMLGCHVQVIADDASDQRVFDKTLPPGL